jgi:hypothetical protein
VRQLIIYIECEDDDVDWLRSKCVPAVENEVDEAAERLDNPDVVDVSWDIVDV